MPPPGFTPYRSELKCAPSCDDVSFLSGIMEMQRDLAEVELDPQIVMRTAAQRAIRLTNADGASFQLIERDFLICSSGAGIMYGHNGLRLRADQSLSGFAVRCGRAQYVPDCETDLNVDRAVSRRIGFRSIAVAPLSRGGVPFGVLCVTSRRANAFNERHISALTLMAGVVAASFSNAAELEIKKKLLAERTQALTLLRESELRFHSAFEHAAIGMALVSLDGNFLQINRSFCKIVGYDEPEMLATNFQSITHPGDLEADLTFVKQLTAGEIPNYQMTKRYLHKEGNIVWVLLSVSIVRDEAGLPLYFISQVQDVTQRKQMEEALRASEEEYRATFELAGIGKAQTDLQTGRFLRVNGKFCEMTGYSAEELCTRTFMSITHPDDIAMGHEAREKLIRGEINGITNEKRFIRKDGKILWVILNIAVINDSSGRPNRAVATFQDITDRKHSEWLERDCRRVLEMVATDLPIEQVLQQLTDALQRQIDGSLAAVMALDNGEIRIHETSLPPGWREALQTRPINLAANLAETIWNAKNGGVTFIETDPAWTQMRPSASEHRIKACWATVIHSTDGTPLGLIVVFSNEARRPTEAEVQALDMYAKLATICIDHYNTTRRLSHLVRHDTLTGLPNRLMFEDRLHQALAVASRSGRQVALMLLDIDKFKAVNDTFGHQMGDHLLQQLSQRLRSQLRQADTMARLGGDEFVIVLPELTSREGAITAAQKLVDCLVAPFDLAGQSVRATTSIGIAFFPDDGSEAVILQKKADAALYRAKERGRNCFSL